MSTPRMVIELSTKNAGKTNEDEGGQISLKKSTSSVIVGKSGKTVDKNSQISNNNWQS